MKNMLLITSSLFLAVALAGAQDTLGSQAKPGAQDSTSQAASPSSTAQNTVLRGCLSGSTGNFTLTDQNGMQYKLMGNDAALQTKVGHEIEVTGTENQSASGSSDSHDSVAQTPNGLEVSDVRDVSGNCRLGRGENSQPQSESQGDKNMDPARPRLVAMLQQPMTTIPDSSAQQNGSTATTPTQNEPQSASQNPAASQSPAGSNPPTGTGASNNNAVTSGDARGGQTPPSQGTTGNGQTGAPASTASPQTNTNDQNKPLYERQATDVPWATHSSSGNSGNTASSSPQ